MTWRGSRVMRKALANLPRYLVLLAWSLVVGIPIVWMLLGSLKPANEVLGTPIKWLPTAWMWTNYLDAWNALKFGTFALNSLAMTAAIVIGQLGLASLAGYGFAKFRFPGQRASFIFVLSTMMLPVQVTMIPLFVVIKTLGWVNTYQGLIVPLMLSAFSVFFMRQYMTSIPNDLIEAARLDGAGELEIFARVVLPICKPALAGLGVLVAMSAWGEFLWPLLVSTKNEMYTLPIGLSMFKTNYWTPYNWLLAMSVVVTIPPVIAFALTQRQLVESGALTGMK